jgi:hypothetical protein
LVDLDYVLSLSSWASSRESHAKVSPSRDSISIAQTDCCFRFLPALNMLGAFWTIGGGIAWAVSFGVMAPKHDANFIFKLFINNSGYTSSGWVFIMSFYTPMYGLYGTDGMMHLVEEMRMLLEKHR